MGSYEEYAKIRLSDKYRVLPNGCWEWIGATKSNGKYGQMGFRSKTPCAHIVSYIIYVGEIPSGMQVDHLCRNTLCVNPEHLEAVTPEENVRRRKEHKTHCSNGHKYTEGNTRYHSTNGSRICRMCEKERSDFWHKAYRGV